MLMFPVAPLTFLGAVKRNAAPTAARERPQSVAALAIWAAHRAALASPGAVDVRLRFLAINAEHFGRGEAYCQTHRKLEDRQVGTHDRSSFGHRGHEWWAKIELPSQK